MNKKMNKEIMKRSRLIIKFLKIKCDADKKTYNKQRRLCLSLIRNEIEKRTSLLILIQVKSQITKPFARKSKTNFSLIN